ncbi:hypothetical protein [Roseateles sp. MS654]|uniref:hypothetical protein n=1 Tax=Roseateles sp. MS654 TaxID=3412685 RepID=UPI003C2FB5C7
MAHAIKRAFVISAEARVASKHDFGLDKPVMFAHPDDAYIVSAQRMPSHVIVCTDRGGECVLGLYLVDKHYECLVASGPVFSDLLANHVGLHYTQYALTEAGWLEEFNVIGLDVLHANVDGEFAGTLVDGGQLTIDGTVEDTTATWRLGYNPVLVNENLPGLEVSDIQLDAAEMMRLFQSEMAKVEENTSEVTA